MIKTILISLIFLISVGHAQQIFDCPDQSGHWNVKGRFPLYAKSKKAVSYIGCNSIHFEKDSILLGHYGHLYIFARDAITGDAYLKTYAGSDLGTFSYRTSKRMKKTNLERNYSIVLDTFGAINLNSLYIYVKGARGADGASGANGKDANNYTLFPESGRPGANGHEGQGSGDYTFRFESMTVPTSKTSLLQGGGKGGRAGKGGEGGVSLDGIFQAERGRDGNNGQTGFGGRWDYKEYN